MILIKFLVVKEVKHSWLLIAGVVDSCQAYECSSKETAVVLQYIVVGKDCRIQYDWNFLPVFAVK